MIGDDDADISEDEMCARIHRGGAIQRAAWMYVRNFPGGPPPCVSLTQQQYEDLIFVFPNMKEIRGVPIRIVDQ